MMMQVYGLEITDPIFYLLMLLASSLVVVFSEHQLSDKSIADKPFYIGAFQVTSFIGLAVFVYSFVMFALSVLPSL